MVRTRRLWCKRAAVLPALLILFSTWAHAQRFPFHNLSVDDGLIQSQATSITQDKSGALWIGTFGGLSRYDGRNFTSYTTRNGLPSNTIWAVCADGKGNIWAGGASAISKFDGKTFTHFDRPRQQAPHLLNYTQQIQVSNDTIWWRVAGELYFIVDGKVNYYTAPGPPGFVSAMLVEKEGMWLAKDGILYYITNGKKADTTLFKLGGDYPTFNIFKIYKDDAGMLLTTNVGLCKVEKGQIAISGIADTASATPAVSCITRDKNGSVWLGTAKGVIRVTGKQVLYYNKRNGLSDNSFSDVFTDMEGNVWMASDGQGLFRYAGTQFTSLDETMGLPSAQIMAIATNKRDSLFLGTYDAGLYVYKDGKVRPLPFPSSPVPAITSLCYTRKSKLWIGTRGRGLWSYDKEIFRQYAAPERHFPSNLIYCLYEDAEHRLWIGFQNGAMVIENDSFKAVITRNTRVSSFAGIGKDSVLIATDNGMYLYSADTCVLFVTGTAVDSFPAQCFTVQGRNVWMGSSDYGIVRYNLDTRKVLVVNKSSGLRSDFIYNLSTDNEGNIWTGTGFGIHRIQMDEKDEPHITFYGKAQGITGMESNINAVLKMPDGSIWFGTTNGAMHYQPHAGEMSSAPVSIELQSVKLAGDNAIEPGYYDSTDRWNGVPYHLRLPYKKNNIAFTFQAIALSGQQVLYRYRMEGLEAPWSDWAQTNSVSYSALPPGKYIFHVQCQAADGQKGPELSYPFEIITPFQKTTWFRFAVLGACILLGILLQYIVNSRKQRRERLLAKLRAEEQAKIRLRTAEDFHDEIGNKLTRINVLTNVLKSKVPQNADTLRILGQIEDNTGQLYGGTRDILWSLKPSNDNLYEILHRIRDFAGELFQDTEIDFTFTGTDEKWRNFKLPMDMSRNLIMIFKEALNNCLKYAHAKNVTMEVELKNRNALHILLKDDGKGFDTHSVKKGNGISNMHIRAGRLNGRLYVDSRVDKGTMINLTFKLPQNPRR